MKRLFIRNYRIILHTIAFLELIFFFWLWGSHYFYTTPMGLLFTLVINYPIAEFSIKKTGIKDFIEKEKDNL